MTSASALSARPLLAKVGHLPLLARRPMVGSVPGRHKSPHRGSSVEFAEYRSYVPGDDLRRLDWRAYGRTDRYFVKEFEADTNLRLILVVDASGSMKYAGDQGRGTVTKLDLARQLAAALGEMALGQGDAVGLTLASTGAPVVVPPRRRPSHLGAIFQTLDDARPAGPCDLARALHDVAERVQRRALVVVLSDLFAPPGELSGAFQHMRHRKHDVAVFHLLDRDELEFRFQKPTRFVDPEGGASVIADPATITERYLQAVRNYRASLEEIVKAADLDYREVLLGDDPLPALSSFLTTRAGGGGRA